MKLWIIYNKERYLRNQSFAERLKRSFERRDISAQIITNGIISSRQAFPDAAVMRCVNEDLSLFLENKGVRVFNSSQISRICNDKWKTYQFVSQLGIPVLPVCLIDRKSSLSHYWSFPFVMKSRFGHGGTEVFWINNHLSYQQAWDQIQDETVILQKPASNLGKDVRVYVIGGKIVLAMLRESSTDFRSNYCLGGRASIYKLNSKEKEMIDPILQALPFDFVGIDFLFDQDKMVFNEIEDVVGCRMVYSLTDLDLAQQYADYIENENRNNQR